MKKKTIAKVLNEKIEEFAESIKDSHVKDLVLKNTIVTGGSIANMLIGEPVNDYDLYFKDKETTLKVAQYFVKEGISSKTANMFVLHGESEIVKNIISVDIDKALKEVNDRIKTSQESDDEEEFQDLSYDSDIGSFNIELFTTFLAYMPKGTTLSWRLIHNIYHTFKNNPDRIKIYSKGSWGTSGEVDSDKIDNQEIIDEEDGKYEIKFISANAITLSDKTQLIIRFYGDADKIHENFDFVHATSYWESSNPIGSQSIKTNTDALESLISKNLIYKGSKYPLASIFRARKFIYRDWRIDAGQYLKMAFQLNELDLTDPYTLEEQLTGVDLLYFNDILKDYKDKTMKDENFSATSEYFVKVIEKIFE